MDIKFPDTLIKVIALESNRKINKGDIFLVESDDFLWSRFALYSLEYKYVCHTYNNGYNFITLEDWREKQIKTVIE